MIFCDTVCWLIHYPSSFQFFYLLVGEGVVSKVIKLFIKNEHLSVRRLNYVYNVQYL